MTDNKNNTCHAGILKNDNNFTLYTNKCKLFDEIHKLSKKKKFKNK